ncbi:MAG: FHA domain-containing protein [Planctomycetes bacterium]|nr:FHA domain-containing protein [Planctomycetota bacterium]
MPRLFVLSGPDLGKTYSVDGDVRLGRVSDCEVVVRDASVSRVHAKLSLEGDAWVLEDLGSSNGIHLGSVRAKRFELSDGDVFKLGKVELRFRADELSAPQAAPVELTPEPAPVEPAPASAPTPLEEEPQPDSEVLDPDFEDEEELFLEEEIDLGISDEPSPEPASSPAPPPAPAPELKLGVGGAAPRSEAKPKPKLSEERRSELRSAARGRTAEVSDRREREILQFSTHRSDATAMTSDLSQHPLWVRALVFLLVLGVSAALFWFAFKGTSSLTGSDEVELDPSFELEGEY